MTENGNKRLIVIVGPTAVGKTKVAIELAKVLRTEIVSADSRQLYKEMSIGTAKPSAGELEEVPHHFIDHVSVSRPYDAAQYGSECMTLIHRLFQKYDTLIICGGSGMYIKAALEGFDEMPEVKAGVRDQIIQEYEQNGMNWLQQQVEINDPDYFGEVDKKNPQRLMRALELIRSSGKTASELRKNKKRELSFDVVKIGLELDREMLYDRINTRVDTMIKAGLVDEAKALYPMRANNALQTVGYQEFFGYFDGQYDMDEAVRLLKRNTRRYAKRQLTWFKRDSDIKWFVPENIKGILDVLDGE